MLDRPIIAIAPIGDALMEDVLLELRLVLGSAFVGNYRGAGDSAPDRKGVALCAGNGGADDGAGLSGAHLATLQHTCGQYFDGLTPSRALDQRVGPEWQPAPIRSAWAPARSTTMSHSTACATWTFSVSPEVA